MGWILVLILCVLPSWTGAAVVPDCIGVTQEVCSASVSASGLILTLEHRYDDASPGLVFEQLPLPGTLVSDNSTVTASVSEGPEPPEITAAILWVYGALGVLFCFCLAVGLRVGAL